ncbi:mobile element protein [Lacipirellula parvula]|uniref:Mobile element protein n=1 Tax=Lacipirellula parvula TaxID=2650471 RepID=A0A5K7XBK1_9BACT|nr:mobile element protein [Lacipirellula parvula]
MDLSSLVCTDTPSHLTATIQWKKEYGGLRMDQAKRLKELEKENARLKRLLADAELDKAILKEAASGNWTVNHKRVERLWRQEGLKVPQKQNQNGGDCGSPTARACGCAHPTKITSGATTSSPIARATAGRFGCSP